MIRAKSILTAVVTMVFVAACGGGGGGGDDDTITANPATGVTITTDNAETVATEVVGTVDMVEGANTGTGLLTGVVVSASDGSFNYADFSLAQLDRFAVLSEQALSSGVVGVVLPATPEDCPNGGSVTVSGTIDDATGTTLSPGDSLSLVFNDCNIEGTLFTGGFDLTIEAISPDFLLQTPPEAFELTFKLVINDLSVTEAGETFSSNGDMTLALSDDGAGNIASTMSGTSLTATVAGETETLSNYTYVLTENSLAHYTIDITGTLDSTILGGSVDFITEVVFEGDGEDNPTVGTLHIYSTFDASQARVIALDETNVRIDVDTDGDDGYVQTFTTWAELEL